jgi:outer membrane protein TolC
MRHKGLAGALGVSVLGICWGGISTALAAADKLEATDAPYVLTVESAPAPASIVRAAADSQPAEKPPVAQKPAPQRAPKTAPPKFQAPPPVFSGPVLDIDLPTALRLVNAGNPTIAVARARVDEAYARLREAQALWLPNLETGPAYNRLDGNNESSHGEVFRVSKSALFEGGGAALRVQSSDALFAPLIARRLAQAEDAASRAVTDQVQLEVALAYLDLLRAYGALAVNADTLGRAEELFRAARAAKEEGKSKTGADLERASTEVQLRTEERTELEIPAAEASARLAQLLLLDPTVNLRPVDRAVVPIALVPEGGTSLDEMVAVALMNRPELAESRELVAAALARWRQAGLGPLLPRLEVAYYGGTFGGGTNGTLDHYSSRGEGAAQMVWSLQGLGVGYLAHTRAQRAVYNQASFHVSEVQAQVGAEVVAAAKAAQSHRRSLDSAQLAITEALGMWRKLRDASFGMAHAQGRFDPLEGLLAEQALNQARLQYLVQVIEYNKAQFRLYRALGQPPENALPRAVSLPVKVPAAPGGLTTPKDLRVPRVGDDKK